MRLIANISTEGVDGGSDLRSVTGQDMKSGRFRLAQKPDGGLIGSKSPEPYVIARLLTLNVSVLLHGGLVPIQIGFVSYMDSDLLQLPLP